MIYNGSPLLVTLEGNPENMGVWATVAKVGAGILKGVGGGISKAVRRKRKKQAAKRKAAKIKKQQEIAAQQAAQQAARQAAQRKQQLTNMIIPAGFAALSFLMGECKK